MEEIEKKIQASIQTGNLDAVILVGVDNFTYLSGVVLPFAFYYPDRLALAIMTKGNEKYVICPLEWSGTASEQGWKGEIKTYDESRSLSPKRSIEALVETISQMKLDKGKLGIDKSRASASFFSSLSKRLPDLRLISCDDMFRELRLLKTEREIKLLETASKQSDKGIIAALNHLEGTVDVPGYTISEFAERVRVHIFEYGGSGVAHLGVMQGTDAQMFYALQRGNVRDGELLRIDVTNHYFGYWSNAGRMAVTGKPTHEQVTSYDGNLILKTAAEEKLKPGIRCSDVFHEVKKTAEKEGIKFWEDAGVGHGVGANHREAPYLDPFDDTQLKPGMVLALDIYSYGPRHELIHCKDTYEIVQDGCNLLSWYKDWNELYGVVGFRTTH